MDKPVERATACTTEREAMLAPRYAEIATFMRAPRVRDPRELDIALIGVPFDGGVTNRPGARHGPREIRNMSSLMRAIHHVTKVNPYDLCRIGDLGDVAFSRIYELEACLDDIAEFYTRVHAAGAAPLSAGGDHAVTLPIFRAIADKKRPLGMVHIDAHTDTWDEFLGSKYMHGTPFRRAVEEGLLDPKRTIQIGIRGAQNSDEGWTFSLESGMRVVFMEEFTKLGVEAVIAEARRVVGDGATYISFDVDGLDPGLRAGHRHARGRWADHHRGASAAARPARARSRRRRRGRGGPALRPERQHRPGRRHHDVRDPLPARRSGRQAPGRMRRRAKGYSPSANKSDKIDFSRPD